MTQLNLTYLIKKLWPVLHAYRKRFLFGVILIFLTTAIDVWIPILIGKAADAVVAPHLDGKLLKEICLLFLALILLKCVLESIQAYAIQSTGLRVTHDLRVLLFKKIERLSVPYFDEHPTGRLLTRVINDVRSLSELFTASMSVLVLDVLVIVGTIIAMFVVNWKLAAIVLISFPVVVWVVLTFGKRLAEAYREVRVRLSEINSFLGENIGAVATIQRLGAEEARASVFDETVHRHNSAQMSSVKIYAQVQPWANVLNGLAMGTLLGVGGYWVIQGELTIGILVAFLGYIRNLFQPVRDLVEKYNVFLSAMVSAERVVKVLDEPEEDLGNLTVSEQGFGEKLGIRFERVSFSYSGRTEKAIKEISFEVPSGKTLAIVGPTGSGKSSIIRLLLRFYEPQEGEICFGDKNIREWSRLDLRRRIGFVPQDVYLFQGSVRENLTLGRRGLSDEHLIEQCKRSQVWEFIQTRGGLDLEILEGGANLSLGQRQLLSFARVLVLDPKVLILDEATASLDNRIERKLMVAVEELMRGRTAIIIAHRLSTIEKCDSILVLDKGRAVEQGTYSELSRSGGLFQAFSEIYSNSPFAS